MLDAPLKDLVEHLKSYSKSRRNVWIIKSAFTQTIKFLKKSTKDNNIKRGSANSNPSSTGNESSNPLSTVLYHQTHMACL